MYRGIGKLVEGMRRCDKLVRKRNKHYSIYDSDMKEDVNSVCHVNVYHEAGVNKLMIHCLYVYTHTLK